MRKRIIIISLVTVISVSLFSALYYGYRKIEKNRVLAESLMTEMQGKLDSQKDIIDSQQTKLNELQGFKADQEQANADATAQDFKNKKADCEARLKRQQDVLASSQRQLGEDQKTLKKAESGDCVDCYKSCLKSYGCSESSCGSNEKNTCKKNNDENIQYRKKDVASATESVKKHEAELQIAKDECNQYLN